MLQSALSQVPNLDPKLIEDAIVGCSFPEAEQGMNVARMSVLLAGLPQSVGGVTVNRFCASGITAVAMAADRIKVGQADVMIAAGTESMSMIPMGGHHPSMNMGMFKDENIGMAYGMGLTAEKVAQQWKVSREAQDQFALESHLKAIAAQQAGYFKDETTPYEIIEKLPNLATGKIDTTSRIVTQDEGARADSNLAALAKLRPVFAAKGSVTAGNSSQTSDGAGALILVSEKILKQFNLTPLARFVSFAVRGVPPEIMGIGPKEAIPAALKAGGLTQDQLDWIELNEAFAAQSLAVIQDLVSIRPRSIRWAGRLLWATHWVRLARSARHRDSCAAPQEFEIRHGDHVRRNRHGSSRHFRTPLIEPVLCPQNVQNGPISNLQESVNSSPYVKYGSAPQFDLDPLREH